MTRKHSFSIEMKSKEHVNKIQLSDEQKEEMLFEGELGEHVHIEFIEGIILQISGDNGVFRMDLTKKELAHGLSKKKKPST